MTARLFYGRAADIPGCPDDEGLRREISRRVGYDPIVLMSPNGLAVTITRRGDGLVADVRLIGRDGILVGVRTLEAGPGECAELSKAIALAVGIALDMIEKSTAPASEPEPESPEASPAPPVAPSPLSPFPLATPDVVDRPSLHADRVSARLEAGVAIAGSVAVLRTASVGPSIFASLRWETWELGIEVRAELSAGAATVLPAAGLQTWIVAGGPFVCAHFVPWFGCLLASGGSLGAEVSSVPGSRTGWVPYVGLGGRIGVSVPLPGGLAFRPSLSLIGQPLDLKVDAAGMQLWHASPVAGVAQFAIAKRFP